jgi:enoyl-CoA hydratase/carnithine racemase
VEDNRTPPDQLNDPKGAIRRFDEYSTRYRHVAMRRERGILELRLHTDGGPLIWGDGPHSELGQCFADVGADTDNRIVILTGTGEEFIARLDKSWVGPLNPAKWDKIYRNGKRLLENLIAIEVPVIGAINGPARVHAELGVLSDIVIASETSVFQDAPHFRYGTVPSDGVHIVWPLLLGENRGRYFLLTGQKLSADEALRLGVVSEVVLPAQLTDRAWEIADALSRQPDLTLRYTRVAFMQRLRRSLVDDLGYGLALEGLAGYESWPAE